MSATGSKTLPAGIYCPTITFFLPTEEQELDIPTHVRHMEFLARSGIAGVVLQGSTGEAVALDREERKQLISTAKEAFARVGNPGKIIAGTVGAQSTRETLILARDAAESGAQYILTLPPSYFPGAMTPAALQAFYEEVADKSPLPVIIYSYPAVCSGINMDTDLILRLARHPNICGIKHTDHDVGKIAREVAALKGSNVDFTILGGASDYLLGNLAVGGEGAITGMANVAPRVIAKIFELASAGEQSAALEYAGVLSKAEWAMGKGAILGTKHVVVWANGYPSTAAAGRKPLPQVPAATVQHVETEFVELVALERKFEKEGYAGAALPRAGKANGVNGLVNQVKEAISA